MVTDPAVPPMTTAASGPDGVVSVEMLVPAEVTATDCPERTAPETLLTVTVNVAGLPPTASDVADEASVTVNPLMRMGI